MKFNRLRHLTGWGRHISRAARWRWETWETGDDTAAVCHGMVCRAELDVDISVNITYTWRCSRSQVSTTITLWRPLLPYGYSYKASCARPGSAIICNFWHPGTLTLSLARQLRCQKLQMTRTVCFITVPHGFGLDWAVFCVPSTTVLVIWETVFTGQKTEPTVSKYWRYIQYIDKSTYNNQTINTKHSKSPSLH